DTPLRLWQGRLLRAHFRHLSGDPFTDILRTIPELRSVVLGKRKELHSITVDERHVLEIDSECARFLSKRIPERIHMFLGELPLTSNTIRPLSAVTRSI